MTSFSSGARGQTHHTHQPEPPIGVHSLQPSNGSPPTRKRKCRDNGSAPSNACGGFTISESPGGRHSELPTESLLSVSAHSFLGAGEGEGHPRLAGGAGFELGAGALGLTLLLCTRADMLRTGVSHHHLLGRTFLPKLSTGGFILQCPGAANPQGGCTEGWVPRNPRLGNSEPQSELHEQSPPPSAVTPV